MMHRGAYKTGLNLTFGAGIITRFHSFLTVLHSLVNIGEVPTIGDLPWL